MEKLRINAKGSWFAMWSLASLLITALLSTATPSATGCISPCSCTGSKLCAGVCSDSSSDKQDASMASYFRMAGIQGTAMASSKSRSRLLGSLLVLVFLCHVPFAMSQVPTLSAGGTGQDPTTMYVVYFINGTHTSDIGTTTLPGCLAGNSPTAIILEKVDGSLVIGQAAASGMFAGYKFDPIAHPVLTPRYTGLYRCTAVRPDGNRFSANTYQLNVVVPLSATPVPNSTYVYDTTDADQSLTCGVTGYGRTTISWTSSVTLTSNTTQRMPAASTSGAQQRSVSSTLFFAGNDTGISLGVPFTVTCVAEYTDVVCTSGSDSQASVLTNCQNALRPLQSTIMVTAQEVCPKFTQDQIDKHTFSSMKKTVGTSIEVSCKPPYNLTSGNGNVTCQANTIWTALPTCSITHCPALSLPADSYLDIQTNGGNEVGNSVTLRCTPPRNVTQGMTVVTCQGTGRWSALPTCGFTHCVASNLTPPGRHLVITVDRGNAVSDVATLDCNSPYRITGRKTNVTCQDDGTWTTLPLCGSTCAPLNISDRSLNQTIIERDVVEAVVGLGCIDTNYTLVGSASVVCQKNEEWSTPPTCQIPKDEDEQSSSNIGAIIGGTIGGLCGVGFLVFYLVNRSKSSQHGGRKEDIELE